MSSPAIQAQQQPGIIARTYNSGFAKAALTYNSLSTASDGCVYYTLTSEDWDTGAQMFRYDPNADYIQRLGDLTEAVGETLGVAVSQGKCHVNFLEMGGKLYFATHLGFYGSVGQREVPGTPPPGVARYPGGHFVAYDMNAGTFEPIAKAPPGEGIIATALDRQRGLFHGYTWPSGYLLCCDLATGAVQNLGPTALDGEKGNGPSYRALCRSLALDESDGAVYLSTADGLVLKSLGGEVDALDDTHMRRDLLGSYDLTVPGELGYNWRQTFVHDKSGHVFGVHGRTGYLFRFDPATADLEFLRRITSESTRKSGMYDLARHGYLSFKLGPDGETIYFLTGARIDEQSAMAGREHVNLVTYHIPTEDFVDWGPVFLDTGGPLSGVNSIAIGDDGTVYALSRMTQNGQTRQDLVSFQHL